MRRKKAWQVYPEQPELVAAVMARHNLPRLVARILLNRGLAAEVTWACAGIAAGRPVLAGVPRALVRRFPEVECVVFGHFHVPYLGRVGETTVFSPGAVHVVEADPARGTPRGVKGRAYRRYRKHLPPAACVPQVGVLEIADGVVTATFVPIDGGLPAGSV